MKLESDIVVAINRVNSCIKEQIFNLSKLTRGEWVTYSTSQTMTNGSFEVKKVAAMQQELSYIIEGILEYDSHADTCLMWKGWVTLFVNEYSAKVFR